MSDKEHNEEVKSKILRLSLLDSAIEEATNRAEVEALAYSIGKTIEDLRYLYRIQSLTKDQVEHIHSVKRKCEYKKKIINDAINSSLEAKYYVDD